MKLGNRRSRQSLNLQPRSIGKSQHHKSPAETNTAVSSYTPMRAIQHPIITVTHNQPLNSTTSTASVTDSTGFF